MSAARDSVSDNPGLDYVSPLPPVRSGISDYSVDLLPQLQALTSVRVLRLPDQQVDAEIVERFSPQPLDRLGEGGRLPLYQMGNNRHHTAVHAAAMRVPGVLTLHDVVLHHLLLDQTIGRGEWVPYRERLVADHGWIGDAVAWGVWWGVHGHAQQFSLPAHRALLRRQRGVLVHSRWAAGRVAETDPEIAVRAVPMGIPLPAPASAEEGAAFRRRHGLPLDAPVLGSFGFQTPMKRTESIIAALADEALGDAHLVIVGEVAEVLDFEHTARAAGVRERVHVLGYVPFAEFHAAIAGVDLCLNLRYPTAGETSASLLRVLACGRPAVVSEYGQFAELPAEIAVQLPLAANEREEGRALARAVRELCSAPARLGAMGAAARRHVEREHAPERAARAVVAACAELATLAPPGDAAPSLAPPSILLASALSGDLAVTNAEAPWAEGERRELAVRLTNTSSATWLGSERGEGGMALDVVLLRGSDSADAEGEDSGRDDPWLSQPWVLLPRDLAPGETAELRVAVRRPPGAVRLRLKPRLLGREGVPFRWLGNAIWERAL
jgi:glycosyltransferase involved in cell wall biosynthesis